MREHDAIDEMLEVERDDAAHRAWLEGLREDGDEGHHPPGAIGSPVKHHRAGNRRAK